MESFLSHQKYRWLKLFGLGLILLTIIYIVNSPIGGRSGKTFVGYSYGILAALGMMILMWYGVRKRSYYSRNTTLKGVLSVHVWLGIALILLVPLHSGFHFGINLHTLAYVLMVLTILSGVWGAFFYISLAPEIGANRGEASIKHLEEELSKISNQVAQHLTGQGAGLTELVAKLDLPTPNLRESINYTGPRTVDPTAAAKLVKNLTAEEKGLSLKLIELIDRKMQLCHKLSREMRTLFWLRVWLYFHLPIAIMAMLAVLIHIISVFWYW